MATHEEKQRAYRYIDRAERLQNHTWPALIVATGLALGGLYDLTIGIAGMLVYIAGGATWFVGDLYLRAARRIMDRRNPRPRR